ncbi:MAG: hypothetical protein GX267_02790 [Fibrobacter sp.]|jgi:hypothetical protein|nr:hypothetical protein [Fibrobacter sp.]
MKNKIIEHISGIIFVTLLLFGFLSFYNTSRAREQERQSSSIRQFIEVPISNINDPFQRALLKDVMNVFYPDQADKNNQIINELLSTKENEFNKKLQKSHLEEHLSISKLQDLLWMLVKFLFTYIIVMLLTWYGVQTIAVWRFISKKQALERKLQLAFKKEKLSFGKKTGSIFNSIFKSIVYFILFSPAYVIAYSIRTEFNTDSLFFMIILGVISNGLLIMYSNKFYAFLISESRKGYLDTALVKNLNSSYLYNSTSGIPYSSIFKFRKNFKGHVFQHIFQNARFQYLSTIKEQACFLITGLIIIEMALNIHGYLNYEMLRQMLYKNYDVVIVIILSIFYTVKITEMLTDFLVYRESLKYENRS